MTTKFPLYLLEFFTFDIFGSQRKISEDETVNVKGLLSQQLFQPIKIHLKRLGTKFLEEDKLFKEQKTSLIEEYYDKEEGVYKLKDNVDVKEFEKKVTELSQTKIELDHFEFKLEDFNFQGEEVYEIIDFLTKEKEEN